MRILQIARGSASEVECHLLLARDLRFLNDSAYQDLDRKLTEVQRMLTSLVISVEEKVKPTAERPKAAKAAPGASS